MVRNQGDDPILRLKSALLILVMVLTMLLVGQAPQQTQAAKFVLSSHTWSYPDEYGQGIEYVSFSVSKPYGNPVNWSTQYYNGTESAGLEFPNNCTVNMNVFAWMNGTQTGYSFVEGRDQFSRVGLVVSLLGESLFSLENMTHSGGATFGDMYRYQYVFTLRGDPEYYGPNFLGGVIYTVVLTYEIYFL